MVGSTQGERIVSGQGQIIKNKNVEASLSFVIQTDISRLRD